MTCRTDTLFMSCHICGETVVSTEVDHNRILPAHKVISWHERLIAHVQKNHLRKRRDS